VAAPAAPARRDARASGLRYVSVDDPGISRRRAGRGFTYRDARGRRITGRAALARIRALAIPPAWTDVWICARPDGHIQAAGRDARGRRQYRYHADFRSRREGVKFDRLLRFGRALPRIRRRVARDLAGRELTREKVLAAVVSLLERTRLRVGNEGYARENRSFGVSTLRERHVRVRGATLRFRFRGKGGRLEERTIVDRRLAAVIRRCQDLPGQVLFQYEADDGEARAVSSEDVNEYLREAAGSDEFSAKDFRTWTATLFAFRAVREEIAGDSIGGPANADGPAAPGGRRRGPAAAVLAALRRTADELGNTLTVTRASYVHPGVLEAAVEGEAGKVATRRQRSAPGVPDRREELELLALLQASGRRAAASGGRTGVSAVTARRSQVGAGRPAARRTRAAA